MRPTSVDPVNCARMIVQSCLAREFCRLDERAGLGLIVSRRSFEQYRATFAVRAASIPAEAPPCATKERWRSAGLIGAITIMVAALAALWFLR